MYKKLTHLHTLCLLPFLLALLPLLSRAQSSTLVISQLYTAGGTSGATYRNDFVELFNKSSSPISLSGYSLVYTNTGGTSTTLSLSATATVAAGGYYLVQYGTSNSSVGAALPQTADNSATNLATGGGRLDLQLSATLIDRVGYGTAAVYEGPGAASASAAKLAAFRAFGGCTDTNDNAADFSTAAPAPRHVDAAVNPCNGAVPTIASFTPPNGPVGTSVTLSGTGFTSSTGVAFNGTAATAITFTNATTLSATVPSGATTGPLTVTAASGTATSTSSFTVTVPAIMTTPTSLTGLVASQGTASAPQTYQVSGTNLDGTALTITPSAASLEVSLTGTSYSASLSLVLGGSATLAPTTVYVRVASSAGLGSFTGSLANTNGPTTSNVPVSGAVLVPLAPKRWLGAAGTNSWFDASNWEGGTLPGTGDDVVLDHRYVAGKYTVALGNSATTAPAAVSVASLRLRPLGGDSILFVIPSSNTVASTSTSTNVGAALNLDPV